MRTVVVNQPHDGSSVLAEFPVTPLSDEPSPEIGQIRLLSPDLGCDESGPIFVALIDRHDDRFICAPYGRFAEPCTAGELATGRDTLCLRVLCLWNSVDISGSHASGSWVVGELSATELVDAGSVYKHAHCTDDLPESLKNRTGPSLWHVADPRHAYLCEEAGRMAPLRATTGGIFTYRLREVPQQRAAEDRDEYDPDQDSV
jgi:hypothetical protein